MILNKVIKQRNLKKLSNEHPNSCRWRCVTLENRDKLKTHRTQWFNVTLSRSNAAADALIINSEP